MICFLICPMDFKLPDFKGAKAVFDKTSVPGKKIVALLNRSGKIASESFISNDDKKINIFDGALVNVHKLVNEFASKGEQELISQALEGDEDLLSRFHGQFRGMSYDLKSGFGRFFVNQTNSARLYWYHQGEIFAVCSSMTLLASLLRLNSITLSVNPLGARMLLRYGFTLDDHTTLREVSLLSAGQILYLQKGKASVKSYHRFNNEPLHHDIKQVLPQIHDLFGEAVKCEYSYDGDRGHLAFLSGGLDSRMSVFTAVEQGFKNIDCLNFCQTNNLDQLSAQKITKLLGLNYHFFPLDTGNYLKTIDLGMLYNDGQIILHGAAHLNAALKSMDLSGFGILHSGQVGDLVLGSFLQGTKHSPSNNISIGLSGQTDPELESEINAITAGYPNAEMFALYNRAFNAASNGDYASAQSNGAISAFLYPPFASYCFQVSPVLRADNYLYLKWFQHFHPKAQKIKWEKTGMSLNASRTERHIAVLIRRIRAKLELMGYFVPTGMNPFERWYRENADLRLFFEHKFEVIKQIEDLIDPSLRKSMHELLDSNLFSHKLYAYSLALSLHTHLHADPNTQLEVYT